MELERASQRAVVQSFPVASGFEGKGKKIASVRAPMLTRGASAASAKEARTSTHRGVENLAKFEVMIGMDIMVILKEPPQQIAR